MRTSKNCFSELSEGDGSVFGVAGFMENPFAHGTARLNPQSIDTVRFITGRA